MPRAAIDAKGMTMGTNDVALPLPVAMAAIHAAGEAVRRGERMGAGEWARGAAMVYTSDASELDRATCLGRIVAHPDGLAMLNRRWTGRVPLEVRAAFWQATQPHTLSPIGGAS